MTPSSRNAIAKAMVLYATVDRHKMEEGLLPFYLPTEICKWVCVNLALSSEGSRQGCYVNSGNVSWLWWEHGGQVRQGSSDVGTQRDWAG